MSETIREEWKCIVCLFVECLPRILDKAEMEKQLPVHKSK